MCIICISFPNIAMEEVICLHMLLCFLEKTKVIKLHTAEKSICSYVLKAIQTKAYACYQEYPILCTLDVI